MLNERGYFMLNRLTPQDRRAFLIGITLLSVAITYFIWLEPFIESYQQLKNKVLAEQTHLLWMQQAAAEIQQLRLQSSTSAVKPTESLAMLLDKSIAQSALKLVNKQVELKNEQEVRISFEEVNFTQLIHWLVQLHQQYQIQVSTISLERRSPPEMVKSVFVLRRSAH
jgi:general secretion pathway protein M